MNKRQRMPILPRNKRDPQGIDPLVRRAMRDFKARYAKVKQVYIDALNRIPSQIAVNKRYTYQLDQYLLEDVFLGIDIDIDNILLEGQLGELWFYQEYVEKAYEQGTALEYTNLKYQSPVYASGSVSLQNVIISERYRSRVALVRARQFEQMKGIVGETKANLSRVLADGVSRGLNPMGVAQMISDQVGIELTRANRIARTEIPMAMRRARWDESEDAQQEYGLKTMELHISALSPTTRPDHMARHGKLYTTEQVREWYSQGANAINCKCSQSAVMVDEDGKPVASALNNRLKQMIQAAKEYEAEL